jgi:hypothetical protein
MAAKKKTRPVRKAKKKSTKKSPAKRSRAAKLKMPRAAAPPAELKELDSEWRRFIRKSVPDEPLTEVWEAPKGAPSAKTTIRLATKSLARKAKKAKKKAPSSASKTKARKKAPRRRTAKKK